MSQDIECAHLFQVSGLQLTRGPIDVNFLPSSFPIIMISLEVSPPPHFSEQVNIFISWFPSTKCHLPLYFCVDSPCSESAPFPSTRLGSSCSSNTQIRTHPPWNLVVASCVLSCTLTSRACAPVKPLILYLCPFRIHRHSYNTFLVTEHVHTHPLT